jgi:hypothetical protein
MLVVSAAGVDAQFDIVQGVEFDVDFLNADVDQANPIDLTGYTFTFILLKKIGRSYSKLPADRVDWSSYVTVLATDTQFGNNHVARISVPATATALLTANAVYGYTISSVANGVSSEWLRGEATVRPAL